MASLFALFVIICFGTNLQNVQSSQSAEDEKGLTELLARNPTLEYLGSVGGKRFFADTIQRPWHASKAYCEEMGMKIARLQTREEGDFLKVAMKFTGRLHWVDGQDVRKEPQFAYEDGTPFSSGIVGYFTGFSCMTYAPNSFVNLRCGDTLPVLCQL